MKQNYFFALTDLWNHYPAALYAFTVILGSCSALDSINLVFFFIALLLLITPLFTFKYQALQIRILLAIILGISCYFITDARYHFPEDNSTRTGFAEVELNSVRLARSPFGQNWSYRGVVKSFIQDGQPIAHDIPVLLTIPYEKNLLRPSANYTYRLPARLKVTDQGRYILNPLKQAVWHTANKTHSLAEWRFSAKSRVQKHIQDSIRDPHVGSFLSGIATGDFDDRLLSFELNRFGLQHLMAISGLHFSILSMLLALVLSVFLSRQKAALATLGLMSTYFIFLGPSPSVTRAWIALMLGLSGLFVQRRGSGINTLGIGAMIVILMDPLHTKEIGFQFSFGVTAAILLWFGPCDAFLQNLFAKRKLNEVIRMDHWDQHGYCVLYFLRQSLSLCLAVNLFALPLTMYHFHKFPVMSLVYNLFFPFLMSLSLVLLVLACFCSLVVPWAGSQLHAINEQYTKFLLNFAFNLPRSFDLTWQMGDIPKDVMMVYVLVLIFSGLLIQRHMRLRERNIV